MRDTIGIIKYIFIANLFT